MSQHLPPRRFCKDSQCQVFQRCMGREGIRFGLGSLDADTPQDPSEKERYERRIAQDIQEIREKARNDGCPYPEVTQNN